MRPKPGITRPRVSALGGAGAKAFGHAAATMTLRPVPRVPYFDAVTAGKVQLPSITEASGR